MRPFVLAAATALGLSACTSAGTALPHACVIPPPAPADWRLHADGTVLRDALGRVVFLRGVDAGGRSKFAPYMPFEYASASAFPAALAAYMDRAASWGIDSMRVPFTWAALEPSPGQFDEDWLGRYAQLLSAAWQRGIWTVVDFHQDVYSECDCGDGFPCWTLPSPPAPHHDCPSWSTEYFSDDVVRRAFDAFWAAGSPVQAGYYAAWDRMLARFQDTPGVVGFEPINEPDSGTADDDAFTATTLTAFFTRAIAHFRAAAPQALVFVEPTGLDGALVETKLERPVGDFVFAPHFYPIGAHPDQVQQGLETWSTLGAKWNVPVWVGEFGIRRTAAGAVDYLAAHFDAFDALGLGGTLWEYSRESTLWNDEENSVVAADGTEYDVAQVLIRPYARAVAGDAVSQRWSRDAGTLTVRFTPAAGVTELSVPARAFPGGYDVQLSAGCYDATSVPGRLLVQTEASTAPVQVTVTAR